MEFNDDVVFAILDFLRGTNNLTSLSIHYGQIPGGYSDKQIDLHLRHCIDSGFVEGELYGDGTTDLLYLTTLGLRHLLTMNHKTTQPEISRIATKSVFQKNQFELNERLVFILSPFGKPFDTIFANHVKPTVENIQELSCIRADNIYDNQPVIEDIWRLTNEAKIVIADLTTKNANVFYETGLAHAIGKEVILITQSMNDVPFDLRQWRHIVYENTPEGIDEFKSKLTNTITSILDRTTLSHTFPELPQGMNTMEMRVQELESQVEELESAAESARYDDGS